MIHLDSHRAADDASYPLASPYDVLEGWFAWDEATAPSARAGGEALALQPVARPDLGPGAFAFRAYLSWSNVLGAGEDGRLTLSIERGPSAVLTVSDALRSDALAAKAAKATKRDWLARHLRDPAGFTPAATLDAEALTFAGGARFDQAGYGAVNVLDPAYGFSGHLAEKTDGVSAHQYPTLLEDALARERAGNPDFMALDFGAGLKTVERADVIYMEIFDYPSTDVLCVGQALPFADDTFDAVCTLAVLEHVDDPFACTAEIKRVLKPGGLVFSGVPFMQPEHGYPDHF
ncbi:MAG: class I SAM-dependent methyltransferase, partial [Pseudomonadota bacterium]